MTYDVKPAPTFIKQLEPIINRYPEIKDYLRRYLGELEETGVKGKRIHGKHKNFFWKDRFPVKPFGKRKGGRIICYQNPENPLIIIPAIIYLKSDLSSPTSKMFKDLLEEIKAL